MIHKKRIALLSFVLVLLCSLFFTGCSSVDENDSQCAMSKEYNCTYNSESDTTRIEFKMQFTNNTIYDMISEKLTFEIYNDGVYLRNEVHTYQIKVNANKEVEESYCYFDTKGEVGAVILTEYSPTYDTLWNTYDIWIWCTLLTVIIGSIIYIIVMIVNDIDLDDFFAGLFTYLLILLILFGASIYAVISSYWVPVIILFIGTVALFVIILIAHLIKYIFE